MAIGEHPAPGTILICDFKQGFREPEMVKQRPVIVLSPKIGIRAKLCTVVALARRLHAPQCHIIANLKLIHRYRHGGAGRIG